MLTKRGGLPPLFSHAMNKNTPLLAGHGLGLRSRHIPEIVEHTPPVDWFEILSENYMHHRGTYFEDMMKVRAYYPMVMHGVTLSIGSTDPLDEIYLNQLKELIHIVEPAFVSDHMCWTHVGGHYSHDLLPLPMNEATVEHVVARIHKVQDQLQRPILLENVSSYVGFQESTLTEWEFHREIATRSGSGMLLDVNNVFVNALNFGFDPKHYVEGIQDVDIGYIHFGGHEDRGTYLFDTHGDRMKPGAWDIYKHVLTTMGPKPTTFEWDSDVPALDVLLEERQKAVEIEHEILA